MYLGSVKFFKHLIYVCMVSVIFVILFGLNFLNIIVGDKIHAATVVTRLELPKEKQTSLPKVTKVSGPATIPAVSRIDYQLKYPNLYTDPADDFMYKGKTAYLTFDDGPSARTLEILDILKRHNIKATFFVVTKNFNSAILKRIAAEGHAIGIHSDSHRYEQIYGSVEDYLDDFNAAYNKIFTETSVKPQIFRFPGGSINAYNRGIYQEIISEMLRRGFLFYDWNISTGDTNPNINSEKILNNVKASVKGQNKLIILAHDSEYKYQTVRALPKIIEFLKNEGYSFDKLDNSVEPVMFSYQ
jgi:peptidoglycan/xylan/chitin deacetylase (PgdA/CDA1 family)